MSSTGSRSGILFSPNRFCTCWTDLKTAFLLSEDLRSVGMKIRTLEICWISSGSIGTISITPDEGSFYKEKLNSVNDWIKQCFKMLQVWQYNFALSLQTWSAGMRERGDLDLAVSWVTYNRTSTTYEPVFSIGFSRSYRRMMKNNKFNKCCVLFSLRKSYWC